MSAKVPATRTRVGKYELGKTLGEGSFAKVKFARNVDTGDTVAIKILDRVHVLRHRMVEQVIPLFISISIVFIIVSSACTHAHTAALSSSQMYQSFIKCKIP